MYIDYLSVINYIKVIYYLIYIKVISIFNNQYLYRLCKPIYISLHN